MATASTSEFGIHRFDPIAAPLLAVDQLKLAQVQLELERYPRARLVHGFRRAFMAGNRRGALAIAAELIRRRMPPCFWHERLEWPEASIEQRYDLFVCDLLWLRQQHRDQVNAVRYSRGKRMLSAANATFHREAEYAFWGGRRPAWKLVGSLSLSEYQQWECAWLRSTPIKKLGFMIDLDSPQILDRLRADLSKVRRTSAYDDDDVEATLRRRHDLWRCWRITGNAGPTAIGIRYEQMTGVVLSRQLVAKHLQKIRSTLKKKEAKK
jgi:hypothetical protein